MAVRYGMPVSEFLERHTSAELTELYAYFFVKDEKPQQYEENLDPDKHAQLLKQALFKGRLT